MSTSAFRKSIGDLDKSYDPKLGWIYTKTKEANFTKELRRQTDKVQIETNKSNKECIQCREIIMKGRGIKFSVRSKTDFIHRK